MKVWIMKIWIMKVWTIKSPSCFASEWRRGLRLDGKVL